MYRKSGMKEKVYNAFRAMEKRVFSFLKRPKVQFPRIGKTMRFVALFLCLFMVQAQLDKSPTDVDHGFTGPGRLSVGLAHRLILTTL